MQFSNASRRAIRSKNFTKNFRSYVGCECAAEAHSQAGVQLEAQEPEGEVTEDIHTRLGQLAALRAKKQRALQGAEKKVAQVPDPESAEALVGALPLLDVDWELVSDQESATCSAR